MLPDPDTRPFRDRVAALNLGPAERRLADELLSIPTFELGTMTSSDLSQRSGTSRSSIDRLSRRLGYPGLKEMRRALLLETRTSDMPRLNDLTGTASSGDIARHVMGGVASRVSAMAATLAAGSELDRLVEMLIGARQIQMFGSGESAAVCSVFFMRLVRLGLPIMFAEEFHTQVTLASVMRAEDVAIVVSYSGGTRSALWPAELAQANGARLVVITGIATSPLAEASDLALLLPTGAGLPGSAEVLDRIVATALAEVVFECVAARMPDLIANSVRIDDAFDAARARS